METVKELTFAFVYALFIAVVGAAALTGLWMHNFASDCDLTGGTFSLEGGSVFCRY